VSRRGRSQGRRRTCASFSSLIGIPIVLVMVTATKQRLRVNILRSRATRVECLIVVLDQVEVRRGQT
jgi:hypothetical protein